MSKTRRFLVICLMLLTFIAPCDTYAAWKIIDALDISPLIPDILDAFMQVATGGYEYFVGHGNGILYMLVWAVLAISIVSYLLKMFFPKQWLDFFGFSQSDPIGTIDEIKMSQNILKPAIRAIVAVTILLPIKPTVITEWLVNPFLGLGSIYTTELVKAIPQVGFNPPDVECPQDIINQGWISETSCKFMVQPVATLSHSNNQIVKRGLEFIKTGLRGLLTLTVHNAGENFLDIITGIILVTTFVSCNIFMALLVIRAIFNFGMALILYPFQILVWVAKKDDKWMNIWPAISGIVKALQDLIVTMIACGFIMCINTAIVRAMFNWGSTIFSSVAGGVAQTNLPVATNTQIGFGSHSILWLSSILTFFVMLRIFELTRKKITQYTQSDLTGLYKSVKGDAKTTWNKITSIPGTVKKITGWFKNK